MLKSINIDGVAYDEIPKEANAASKILADFYIILGKPQTPFSKSGQKMMELIISVWEDLYPVDAKVWYAMRKDYQESELTIHEQVKLGTGRSLASYPMPIYRMMKKIFKGFDSAERKNCMKMVKLWPMFRMANKV